MPIGEMILIACVEGKGWCDTGSGPITVSPGQVVVLPPGVSHSYGAFDDDPWTVWWIHVAGTPVSTFLAAHGVDEKAPVRSPSAFFDIVTMMSSVVRVMERDMGPVNLVRAAGTAWHLTSLLVSDRSTSKRLRQVLEDAAQVIRENLTERMSVVQFAASAHVSVSHFGSQFRQLFGVSVLEYQLHARMARARELFDTHGWSVAEVGRAVGYDDQFYFSRQFSRLHGVSPTEYRRGNKGGPVFAPPTAEVGNDRTDHHN